MKAVRSTLDTLSNFTSTPSIEKPDAELGEVIEPHLQKYFDKYGTNLPPDGLYDKVFKEIERPLIALSLAATRGNQLKASKLLGLNRNTLRKKIRELNIPITKTPL